MKDVASIKLGHINFGKPQLKKAAVYYASVSTGGSKSDEALLGLAWAFLKEQNFKGASEYAGAIITKNSNSLFVPEAHLLLGYCAFFGKDYNQALAELERAVDLANKKSASILGLKRLRGGNPTAGSEFTAVQSEALKLAGQFPNDRVLKKQEKLRTRFEAVYGDVERYFDYQRDADKYERFLQDKDRIVKDAKFAKATIINIKARPPVPTTIALEPPIHPENRAYCVTVAGMQTYWCARTRDRARYLALRAAWEAGWADQCGRRALMYRSRCVRCPEMDAVAQRQKEGCVK